MRFWMAIVTAAMFGGCGGVSVTPDEGRGVLEVNSNLINSGFTILKQNGTGDPTKEGVFSSKQCSDDVCGAQRTFQLTPGGYAVFPHAMEGYRLPLLAEIEIEAGKSYEIFFEYKKE